MRKAGALEAHTLSGTIVFQKRSSAPVRFTFQTWLRRQDSNLRSGAYEAPEMTTSLLRK